jgi:hypothetical protein
MAVLRTALCGGSLAHRKAAARMAADGNMTAMSGPALRVDAQGDRLRLLQVHAHPDDESRGGGGASGA